MQSLASLGTDWSAFAASLSQFLDLDQTARTFGALIRRRQVKDAASLLRLGLCYGPSGLSLRSAATWAGLRAGANLANTSLLDRLRQSHRWFGEIVRVLLSTTVTPVGGRLAGRTLRLVDGTSLSHPGSKGTDWRVHAIYDLASGGFSHLELTDKHQAESILYGPISKGEVRIADRGYARARELSQLVTAGADFIVRIGWNSLRLMTEQDKPFDLLAALSALPPAAPTVAPTAVPVRVSLGKNRPAFPARLILFAKPDEAAERERQRAEKISRHKHKTTDPRTIVVAGYVVLLTSLPAERFSAAAIADLYRLRWQIELSFNRLKSLLHLDQLRAFDDDLAKSWIYCHFIAALVTQKLSQEILETSP